MTEKELEVCEVCGEPLAGREWIRISVATLVSECGDGVMIIPEPANPDSVVACKLQDIPGVQLHLDCVLTFLQTESCSIPVYRRQDKKTR